MKGSQHMLAMAMIIINYKRKILEGSEFATPNCTNSKQNTKINSKIYAQIYKKTSPRKFLKKS